MRTFFTYDSYDNTILITTFARTFLEIKNKVKRHYRVFLFIITYFWISKIQADPVYIQSIGVRNGLSEPSAISIWQDHLGRMWFGNNAINCYNGKHTKVIRPSEYFSDIEDVNIHHLCGDDSTLFFIAERTVISVNLYTDKVACTNLKAATMYLSGDYLYTGFKQTVEEYHRPTQTRRIVFSAPNTIIRTITPVNEKYLWAGTNDGLFLINIETGQKEASYCEDSNIRSLLHDKDGNLWFSTEDETVWLITKNGDQLLFPEIKSLAYCFAQDPEGKVWIGTLKGLYKAFIHPFTNRPELADKDPIIEGNPISALYVDRQNMLWIGPYYGDVQYLNTGEPNFNIYTSNSQMNDQLRGVLLCTITEDNYENLYIGTRGYGFNIFEKGMKNLRYLDSGTGHLPNNQVYTTFFDDEYNRLYIGLSMQNLAYINSKTKQLIQLTAPAYTLPPYTTVKKILPFRDQLILITKNDGFYRLDRQQGTTSPLFTDSLLQAKCATNIRNAFIDDKGCLWVSSLEEGLFTADLNTGTLIHQYGTSKNGFPYIVNGICGNSINGIYLSTINSGILAFHPKTNVFSQYTCEDNQVLPSNHCFNIAMSAYGKLIVTTNKGFSVIDISVQKKLVNAFHIHLDDLYPLNGFSSDCDIHVSPYSKNIYLGTLNGIVSFNEQMIGQPHTNYQLLFSELKINDVRISPENSVLLEQDIAFTRKLTLPYDQNSLNISFSSTNFSPTRYTQYEYKLEGLDTHWTRTENYSITYPSLRPGKYTLTVRETTDHKKAISMKIEVLPPFWLSWPALLLYVLSSTLLITWFVRFNRSKKQLKTSLEIEKKQKEQIENINKEKLVFLTRISNEFRVPLTIIITLLNSIVSDDTATGKGRIHKVIKQALYLQNLITQLFDFSMGEEAKIKIPDEKYEDERCMPNETNESYACAETSQEGQHHYTILIIDLDPEFRALLHECFSFAYTVIESDNGDEGYEIATKKKPDIIICEKLIHGIPGIELCKILKSNIETLHIPFIILSHQPSENLRMQIVRAGADDYFIKPFEMDVLQQRCNHLISNRRDILTSLNNRKEHVLETLPIANTLQNQQFIEKSIRIIEQNLNNIYFDTQQWCKELGIGRTSLFGQFKEITGMTPNDYLLNYKIKKAQIWLREEELTVAEIGYKLGYSDPGYFSRTFKKFTGQSPQQFRKRTTRQITT